MTAQALTTTAIRAAFQNIWDPRLSDRPPLNGGLRQPLSRARESNKPLRGFVRLRHDAPGQMLKALRRAVVEPTGHADPSPCKPVAHPMWLRPSMTSVVPSAAMLFIDIA